MKVYDASALLAVVFAEPGGDAVLEHLAHAGGCVSAVNWAEVATRMIDRGVRAAQVEPELAHFGLDVIALDAATALRAAELRASTRKLGLSVGDRCCLALAQGISGAVVVTADRAWKGLKPFDIQLVR